MVSVTVFGVTAFREADGTLTTQPFGATGGPYDIGAPASPVSLLVSSFSPPGYDVGTGTSAATAMVSGALGLMTAKDPSLSGQDTNLKQQLLCNGAPNPVGSGELLDAHAAVVNLTPCP